MKLCPTCRGRFEDAKKFCRRDGARLVPEKAYSPEVVAKRELLEKRLVEGPESSSLFVELGDLYASIPLYDEALVQFFKALETDSESDATRRRIAAVHRARGEWAEAARQLEVLAERNPADVPLLEELADAYARSGRLSEAAELLARCCDLAPADPRVWARRRDLLVELRRPEELLLVRRHLAALYPGEPSCWLELAEALVEADASAPEEWAAVDRALAPAVDKAKAMGPEARDAARLYLAWARLRLGAVGPEVLERLRSLQPTTLGPARSRLAARAAVEAGALCRRAFLEPEAVEAYKLALRFEDDHEARRELAALFERRAEALTAEGKYREAARTADAGLSFCPEDADLLRSRRRALRKRLLRRALWAGAVLVALAAVALALLYRSGEGLFGEAPTSRDLVRSFGNFLERQAPVTSFVSRDGGKDLSFELGRARWRVVVRGATVRSGGDVAASMRGTLDTSWAKDGTPVTDLRSLPPELTKLGIGARLNAAAYNPYRHRWTW